MTDPDIAAVREGLTRVEVAPDGHPSIIVGAIDEPAAALARLEARLAETEARLERLAEEQDELLAWDDGKEAAVIADLHAAIGRALAGKDAAT